MCYLWHQSVVDKVVWSLSYRFVSNPLHQPEEAPYKVVKAELTMHTSSSAQYFMKELVLSAKELDDQVPSQVLHNIHQLLAKMVTMADTTWLWERFPLLFAIQCTNGSSPLFRTAGPTSTFDYESFTHFDHRHSLHIYSVEQLWILRVHEMFRLTWKPNYKCYLLSTPSRHQIHSPALRRSPFCLHGWIITLLLLSLHVWRWSQEVLEGGND